MSRNILWYDAHKRLKVIDFDHVCFVDYQGNGNELLQRDLRGTCVGSPAARTGVTQERSGIWNSMISDMLNF
jgi:hypothetical protein